MSTAHRPTWVAALGGTGLRDGATSAPTNQKCNKDMPAHTKIKYRQIGQDAPEEIQAQRPPRRTEKVKRITEDTVETDNADEDLDADTDIESEVEENGSEEEEEESEDEEDETEELLRELEKIKREREAQKLIESTRKEQELLSKNPLINLGASGDSGEGFAVKRRWDDDVVFKNQAKGVETKPKKRFINDTTRSDFHRKFLDRYIL